MQRTSAAVLIVAAGLAGCATTTESLAPQIPSMPGLRSDPIPDSPVADRGIAIMTAGIDGLKCASGHIVLARRMGNGYAAAHDVELEMGWAGTPVGTVVLDPGEYHVVQYACRNGKNVTYVGRSAEASGGVPWKSGRWSHSLAAFQISSGEVVDLGALGLKPGKPLAADKDKKSKAKTQLAFAMPAGERAVAVRVGALPDDARATLQKDRPGLVPALKARPMAVDAAATTSASVVKCTLYTAEDKASAGAAKAGSTSTQADPSAAADTASQAAAGATAAVPGNSAVDKTKASEEAWFADPKSGGQTSHKKKAQAAQNWKDDPMIAKVQSLAVPPVGCSETMKKAKAT